MDDAGNNSSSDSHMYVDIADAVTTEGPLDPPQSKSHDDAEENNDTNMHRDEEQAANRQNQGKVDKYEDEMDVLEDIEEDGNMGYVTTPK